MALSLRLSELRKSYTNHCLIYDIGCDHGQLGLSFLSEPDVAEVHLVDPSAAVIQTLTHFIDAYITEEKFKITVHAKTGQDVVLKTEKKLVLIAGMGGKEIGSICAHLANQLSDEDDLVISPHRDILALREALHRSSYFMKSESIIEEEGRFYQVMNLSKSEGSPVSLYGESIWESEAGKKYRLQQLAHFSAHQDERSRNYVNYLLNKIVLP